MTYFSRLALHSELVVGGGGLRPRTLVSSGDVGPHLVEEDTIVEVPSSPPDAPFRTQPSAVVERFHAPAAADRPPPDPAPLTGEDAGPSPAHPDAGTDGEPRGEYVMRRVMEWIEGGSQPSADAPPGVPPPPLPPDARRASEVAAGRPPAPNADVPLAVPAAPVVEPSGPETVPAPPPGIRAPLAPVLDATPVPRPGRRAAEPIRTLEDDAAPLRRPEETVHVSIGTIRVVVETPAAAAAPPAAAPATPSVRPAASSSERRGRPADRLSRHYLRP